MKKHSYSHYTLLSLRRNGHSMLWLILTVLAVLLAAPPVVQGIIQVNADIKKENVVILDPGHGGIDPGAIGVNGIKEKEVNLDIALILKDMLTLSGYSVIMTRESDISVNDPKYTTVASIKSSDLKNRLKLMKEYPDAPVILIHQNEYLSSSSHGAQMFYGRHNENSRRLAESLRASFVELLQPDNRRECKKSTSAVYVLHNAPNPVVLAECGFLSNYNEAELLSNSEYRQRVAFALYCGFMRYENSVQPEFGNAF